MKTKEDVRRDNICFLWFFMCLCLSSHGTVSSKEQVISVVLSRQNPYSVAVS